MKLVPIVLIAIGTCAIAQTDQLRIEEQKAVKEIERVGGTFAWITEDSKELFCLDIENKSKVFDFRALSGLNRLNVLRIFQGKIENKSLVHLTKLNRLELLVITSEGLTNDGTKFIGKLTTLTKLDLMSNSITGKGLQELRNLKSLRRLFLYNTTVVDADLVPLAEMTWLDELCLPTTITDAGLAKLKTSLPKTSIRKF